MGALALAGELAARLAGFLAFVYLARTLGPAAYGGVELAAAVVAFCALCVDGELGTIGARELERDSEASPRVAAGVATLRLLFAGLAILALGLATPLLRQPPSVRWLIALFGAALLAAPWQLGWLLRAHGRAVEAALGPLLRAATFAALVVALVRTGGGVWRVGVSEVAAAAAVAAFYLAAARPLLNGPLLTDDFALLGRLLRQALPAAVGRAAWGVGAYAPVVLVAVLAGGLELAWIGAAHRVVAAGVAFVSHYHFNLAPRLARALAAPAGELAALWRASCRATAWLGVLAALAGGLFAAPICRLIFGEAYRTAAPTLAVMMWVLPVLLLAGHSRALLQATGGARDDLLAGAAGAAVTVALAVFWTVRWGAPGAAAAMVAGELAGWGAALLLLRPRLPPGHRRDVPFLGPLLRPAFAGLAAIGVAALLPAILAPRLAALIALAAFAVAAPVLEPALRRDVVTLLRTAPRRAE